LKQEEIDSENIHSSSEVQKSQELDAIADNSIDTDLDAAVVLAVRMAAILLNHARRSTVKEHNQPSHLKIAHISGLCGNASDVTPLQLGRCVTRAQDCDQNSGISPSSMKGKPTFDTESHFTLDYVYQCLVSSWSLTENEQREVLSLDDFHRLAAIAARNAVGVSTQSPFSSYYNALLRTIGGRGSVEQHETLKSQVAQALGSHEGQLNRGMDRSVQEKVAAQIVGIFPLMSRINHSCSPNAEIRSGEYVDCHIDVVAVRDIYKKEEITISYIPYGRGVGQKTCARRRRELQSKYLFFCNCEKCHIAGSEC